jgi:lipopolysaccharide/colanic/teichoic acid biosynthesis glycosyltransferase
MNTVTRIQTLLIVAAMCLLVQTLSATLQARSLETPNTSAWIARTIVEDGRFASGALRAYHLPGEPLYLAAGFAVLPESFQRYLHVPVVVLLATSIAAVGFAAGGPPLGLAAGLIATFDPFVVIHGPVWDDTFLAAALDWSVFAIIATACAGAIPRIGSGMVMLVAIAAAIAVVTRTQSQLVLASTAIGALSITRLRPLRPLACTILIGATVGLGVWGARNAAVLGSFLVGSTRDGKALFESNCSYTRQGVRELGLVGGFMSACSPTQVAHARSLDEVQANRQLRQYAVAYMTSNPLDVAGTAAFKLAVSGSGVDFGSHLWSARNRVAVAGSLLTITLGLVGLWRLRRDIPQALLRDALTLLCVATGIVTVLMLALGPTGLRYRIGLAGFLYLGVAVVVTDQVFVKRAFDASLAAAGLILSMPLWVAFAIAIKLEDGGEVFYAQERVGLRGRTFSVLKFRSMRPDAEALVGPIQAAADDPRITRVGRWLRATAMDELPQLWNIFRGDMSFVGPRALRPGEIEVQGDGRVEKLEQVPGFKRRCAVRPGLTGIAQIYAPRDIPRRQKFRYDGVYLRQQTMALDLRLILLSFWITFRGSWESRGKKF